MKMKSLPLSFLFLLFFALALPAQSVQKTLVRAFNVGAANEVVLDVNAPVTVQTWSAETVRVQMQIALDNVHESMLQSLVSAGRYNLKGEIQGAAFIITAPSLRKTVRVGEQALSERISFTVFAPEGIAVTVPGVKLGEGIVEGVATPLKPM